jgi:hypothetical protein
MPETMTMLHARLTAANAAWSTAAMAGNWTAAAQAAEEAQRVGVEIIARRHGRSHEDRTGR